jgi:hypothetical protein
VVDHLRGWNVVNPKARANDLETKIHILRVHEIALVEQSHQSLAKFLLIVNRFDDELLESLVAGLEGGHFLLNLGAQSYAR